MYWIFCGNSNCLEIYDHNVWQSWIHFEWLQIDLKLTKSTNLRIEIKKPLHKPDTLRNLCVKYIHFQSCVFHAYGMFLFDEHIIMVKFEAARLHRTTACKKSFWFCSVSFSFILFNVPFTAQCTYEITNYWHNFLPLNLIWNIEHWTVPYFWRPTNDNRNEPKEIENTQLIYVLK